VIDGTTIKMTKSAKWLGIIIDQELCSQTHTAYTIKKGTDYMQQYHQLARNANGVRHKYLKQYFTMVATPRMLYGAEVWIKPLNIQDKTS
jgi:hypothetical protein